MYTLTKAELKCVLEFTSKDTTRPAINAVHLSDDKMQATDSWILIDMTIKKEENNTSNHVLITRDSIEKVVKQMTNKSIVYITQREGAWVASIDYSADTITLKTLDGQFPNCSVLLDIDHTTYTNKVHLSSELLAKAIKAISLVSPHVELCINGSGGAYKPMTITSKTINALIMPVKR